MLNKNNAARYDLTSALAAKLRSLLTKERTSVLPIRVSDDTFFHSLIVSIIIGDRERISTLPIDVSYDTLFHYLIVSSIGHIDAIKTLCLELFIRQSS